MRVFNEIKEWYSSEKIFDIIENYCQKDKYNIDRFKDVRFRDIESFFITPKSRTVPEFRINYDIPIRCLTIIRFNILKNTDLFIYYDLKTKRMSIDGKVYNNELNNKFYIFINEMKNITIKMDKE